MSNQETSHIGNHAKQKWRFRVISVTVTALVIMILLWISPWGQITECRYRFNRLEAKLTDNGWSQLINSWMWDFDWWPWAMTRKKWAIEEIVTTDRWKTISRAGLREHLKSTSVWAQQINDASLRAEKFKRLTDVAGRYLGDKPLAFDYLKKWIAAAKLIESEDKRQLAFLDISEVVGGLNDRQEGLAFLDEIDSEMKRINDALRKGWGFRSIAEAAGQLGAREQVVLYWSEARRAADHVADDRRYDLYWRPLYPKAACILMEKDGSSSSYFFESLSYVMSISNEFDRVSFLGDLAKTAVFFFDKTKAIYYLNQFRANLVDLRNDPAKQTLIANLAEAAGWLSDTELATIFLNNLQDAAEIIQDPWHRSIAYQALALSAKRLGDNHRSFEYFTLATDLALRVESPVSRVWQISVFLLPKAKELGFDMNTAGLLPKLEVVVEEIKESKTGDARGLIMFKTYQYLAKVAVQLGAHEKGLHYLSQAITLTESETVRAEDLLDLAKTAKDLRELSQTRKLAQKAFDMAKVEIKGGNVFDGMHIIAGGAKIYANIGEIRYAVSLAEDEAFSSEAKAAIFGVVLAEYAENHYPKIK